MNDLQFRKKKYIDKPLEKALPVAETVEQALKRGIKIEQVPRGKSGLDGVTLLPKSQVIKKHSKGGRLPKI